MNKKNIILALVTGFTFLHSTSAMVNHEEFEFDINSIVYIEDEVKIDLGFDTADYLPENFDPYKSYFDLNKDLILMRSKGNDSNKSKRIHFSGYFFWF